MHVKEATAASTLLGFTSQDIMHLGFWCERVVEIIFLLVCLDQLKLIFSEQSDDSKSPLKISRKNSVR